MTIRWISEKLGTSPWRVELVSEVDHIVDVRVLRDTTGNSPTLIKEKIAEALNYLKQGKSVVICCDYGISRSNAIAAAVLAEEAGTDLGEGLRRVIQRTGETAIKIDFVEDLRRALCARQRKVSVGRTLVLGTRDFIGRSIVRELSNIETDQDQNLIDNPVLLDAALEKTAADQILFCWHPPQLDTNRAAGKLIESLRNVLDVCRIRRAAVIFLSGHQVFSGYAGNAPAIFSEAANPLPAGAAGDGLFLAETLVKQYELRYGLRTLVVRSSNVYGPGDDRPGLMYTLINKALAQDDILTHCYENGVPEVDFIHVHDFAGVLKLAIEKEVTGVLHVVSGNPIATDSLARLIISKTASKSLVSTISMPGVCNMTRLQSLVLPERFNWHPSIGIENGLDDIIAGMRQRDFL